MFKRGVSSVVVTVLIVLLSLVGTSIIFVVVNNFLEDAGSEGDVVECFALDISPIFCEYDSNSGDTQVSVERGTGSAELNKVRFVFDSSVSTIILDRDSMNIGELESKTFTFDSEDLGEPFKVSVAGILLSGRVCPLSGIEIPCSNGARESFACSDGEDNDGDGWIDELDPGCSGIEDDDETDAGTTECNDGIDNDGDGWIDELDPNCLNGFGSENDEFQYTWIKLNNGNPIDAEDGFAGEGMSNNDLLGDRTYVDSEGNLIYFYYGSDPYLGNVVSANSRDTRIGKLSVNKEWQFLGFNGWTKDSSKTEYPVSFGGNIYQVAGLIFSHEYQQDLLFGIVYPRFHIGANGMDIHGSAYNFIFNLLSGETRFWRNQEVHPHLGQALLYNWGGSMGSYSIDSDFAMEGTKGILISQEVENVGKLRHLIAAKYDFSQGSWKNWKDNGWNGVYGNSGQNKDYTYLPFLETPFALTISPRISNVLGTSDYLITFIFENSGVKGIGAAKYEGDTVEWKTWDGSSWNTNYNNKIMLIETSNYNYAQREGARKSVLMNGDLYEFYTLPSVQQDKYDFKVLKYNFANEIWSSETLLTLDKNVDDSIEQFVVKVYNNEIWIGLETGNDIVTYSYDGVNLNDLDMAYTGSTAYPYALDFYDGNLVLFFVEDFAGVKRLFALGDNSENYWDDEVVRSPKNAPVPTVLTQDKGSEVSQWADLNVFASIKDNQGNDVYYETSASGQCGHLGIDSEENIYCPSLPTGFESIISIFPSDYNSLNDRNSETAHAWGGTQNDYFSATGVGAVAIHNTINGLGKVYILERYVNSGGGDVYPQGRIQIWDKSRNSENLAFRVNGQTYTQAYIPQIVSNINSEKIVWPSDVAVDEVGNLLYLTESGKDRVVVFTLGSSGSLTYQREITGLNFPTGIDTDSSGNVYVADSENNKIVKYGPSGNKIGEWGSQGRDSEEFIYPYALAVDKVQGYVYVADTYNRRIQIFDLNGMFIYQFSSWTGSSGVVSNFDHVNGIAVHNGEFYASSYDSESSYKRPVIIKFQMNLP
ncbi:hypothetical protein COU60_04875 [Candidatus Pacearchaeota archaeon CG10_big_fil_rev_8_21_14_0_10_34_76]|nr:MAG: hypothetical protein COU60_04875 [Candidatus Pacearchaeota archaeon CG10_big_fil_rev_8_21_14_0_10_34_76]